MLEIKCPTCERHLQLPEEAAERDTKCPACGAVFAWAHVARNRHRRASTPEGSVAEPVPTTDPLDIENHDVEVMAERARLLRELEDERLDDAESMATEMRWHECKSAATKGFFVGLIAAFFLAFVALFSKDAPDLCGQFWMSVGVGLIGMTHGFLIVHLTHLIGPPHVSWTQKLLVAMLTSWIIAVLCLDWWSKSAGPTSVDVLMFAAGTGLVIVLVLWLIVAGFLVLGRAFRK